MVTLVQHGQAKNTFTSSPGSLTVTLGANITAGNCVIACISASSATDGAGSQPTISSVKTNASADNWAVAKSLNDTTNCCLCAVYADPNTVGGTTNVVTAFTFVGAGTNNPNAAMVDVFEVSGLLTSSVVDLTHASAIGASGTAWSSGASGTTGQGSEFIVGMALGTVLAGGANGPTLTGPSAPWTNETAQTENPSVFGTVYGVTHMAGYQIVTSTGTFTYSGTQSPSEAYDAIVVTLKGAATTRGTLLLTSFPV